MLRHKTVRSAIHDTLWRVRVGIDFLPTFRGRPINFLHALAIAPLHLMPKGVEDALFERFAAGEFLVIETGAPADRVIIFR